MSENNIQSINTQYKGVNFSGTTNEYFGIWIVNIILSIITFGIYSAWAKVKRETFFKNKTYIGKYNFGYHATGSQIFKGRLIAVLVVIVINIISTIFPKTAGLFFLALIFLIPLIINNSMRFSARMISFRNIRFNWHGTYWKTFWFFVIAPIISILSLGILLPLISKSYYRYFAISHSYGTSKFSCEPQVKDYYIAFGIGVVLPIVLLIIAIILTTFSTPVDNSSQVIAFIFPLILVTIFLLTSIVYHVLCRNLMMRSLTLLDVANFNSEIDPFKFVWIQISNILAVTFTLGLMIPWASIRTHKYLSECSKYIITGDLDKFIDEAIKNKSSFGEELSELEGFEVTI